MNDFQPIDDENLAETIGEDGAGERSAFPSMLRIGRYELQDVLGSGGQGVDEGTS